MPEKNVARVLMAQLALLSAWCALSALSSSPEAASLTRSESPSTPVLLTFDVEDRADGPALRQLQLKTPATYFIGGRFAEDSPGVVRDLAENPRNTIGSHSHAHQDLTALDPVEIRKDILLSKLILRELIGYAPSWFRAPFLKTDERVGEVLRELGFTHDSSNSERWMTHASVFELPISSESGVLVSDYDIFFKHRMSDEAALAEHPRPRLAARVQRCAHDAAAAALGHDRSVGSAVDAMTLAFSPRSACVSRGDDSLATLTVRDRWYPVALRPLSRS